MPRYRVNWRYSASTDGRSYSFAEGDEVDLDAAEAEWVNGDSAGVLTPLDTEPEPDGDGLEGLTVKALRAVAEDRGVDLGDAKTKADIVAALNTAAEPDDEPADDEDNDGEGEDEGGDG